MKRPSPKANQALKQNISAAISGAGKSELRAYYLNVRAEMDPEICILKSKAVHRHLLGSDMIAKSAVIHTYLSMTGRNEVDTRLLITRLFTMHKKVAVPVIRSGRKLSHHFITPETEYQTGPWGVEEPVNAESAKLSELDVILVPMVAGDLRHQRLGYGKGFYDRFLSQSNAVKAGLLFDDLVHPEPLPAEPHDHPLDLLITESGIF